MDGFHDRARRIAVQIRQVVSQLCLFSLDDPRLSNVEITNVKMTPDLRIARIYFYVAGGKEVQDRCIRGLYSASSVIKRQLREKVRLKYMPQLEFFFDEGIEVQTRINELLENIKKEEIC